MEIEGEASTNSCAKREQKTHCRDNMVNVTIMEDNKFHYLQKKEKKKGGGVRLELLEFPPKFSLNL